MALSLFATLFIAVLLVIGSKRRQNRFAGNNIDAESSASDGVQEYLEGIKVIKACNMAQACCNDLDVKLDGVVKASTRMAFEAGKFVFSAESILRFGLAFALIAGAYLLAMGQVDRLTYFLFLMAAPVLYDPVSSMLKQITMLFEAGLKIERMRELENQPVQEGETKCSLSHYNIEFKNVSFSYNSKEILHNISFTAQQGQVTALVGPSGSGKSTLAKLAVRFWDVRDGCVMVGGRDVKSIEPETLLAYFSIVFQDVVLFNDTLYNNIKIGKPDAVNEDILAAARAAQCDEFIRRFPLGYDTVIGENGSTLSGGERQRISIARALLKNAPIILLDEATASLDTENESHVQKALSHLVMDKTVIVIAHRMRTVMEADKIVVLQEGGVLEEGTHKTLMEHDGFYKKLVTLQQRSANWTLA
jgi:ATP-binding cassette subfamily B protein